MAWQDEIKVRASFRGAFFRTVDAELKVGRRTVLHEYPLRDDPYTEDLGRRARHFSVEAYVVGDDYLTGRDALIKALEEPGPGQLIHPRYGVLWVAVLDPASVKETQSQGGIARFSITFVEHGANQFPATVEDTVVKVDQAAADVEDAATDDFTVTFDVTGPEVLSTLTLKGLKADLDRLVKTARQVTDVSALGDLVRGITGVSNSLVALIRTPVVLAQSFISLYSQFVQAVKRPLSALAELEMVFGLNRRPAYGALAGSTLARRQVNERARADLQRRLALSQQARILAIALTDVDLTATQARALRDRLLAQVDTELEVNDPPAGVASALAMMRSAVTRDVQQRSEFLRQASTYTPIAVLPSLVLTHRVYQDATRADELVQRNAVRHPAFVPARALEVLQ